MQLKTLVLAAVVSSASALNILEAITSDPQLSVLVETASSTGFLQDLTPVLNSATSNITLFAPSNDAFALLLNASGLLPNASVSNSTAYLQGVLSYHALPTRFLFNEAGKFIVETLLTTEGPGLNNLGTGKGQALVIEVARNTIVIGQSNNVNTTLDSSSQTVSAPTISESTPEPTSETATPSPTSEPIPSPTSEPTLSPTSATGSPLTSSADDFVVTLNKNVRVIRSILTDNGVIHVIDSVLIPPRSVSAIASAANFTSLVGALTASNLVNVVDTTKGITIFAPIDAAFALLNPAPTGVALSNVLKYHVIPGIYYSTDLRSGNNPVATLLGGNVIINSSPLGVTVKGDLNATPSKVIVADVLTDNGVIHVIDAVLLPGDVTTGPNTGIRGNNSSASVMVTASISALIGVVLMLLV